MATAQFAPMGNIPNLFKVEQDMETLFDFNQETPRAQSRQSSTHPSRPSLYQAAPSPLEDTEDRQVFAGPSHEYNLFKQQTGVALGNLSHLNQPLPSSFGGDELLSGFNSGLDDMNFNTGFDNQWATGLDVDTDMGADYGSNPIPTVFFSPAEQAQHNSFVNPTTIDGAEEPQSNVGRLWPGMHQQQAQQAAMAKAMQQRQQQQQQQMQQQQQQQHRQPSVSRSRASSYQNDPHTEESISRLLNRMRQGSMVSTNADEDAMQNGLLPHVQRMRKDEEDMDEDERLLASEEGKKLSSKERRQLRNKVSARAFRSRRKEYIGQLEGEVAVKVQEAQTLKSENQALVEENARYRSLIETLLRHPAFVPYVDEISKDPSLIAPAPHQVSQAQQQRRQQRQQQRSAATTPVPHHVVPSQQPQQTQMPTQQQMQHPGMTMVPDSAADLSMLNINNNNNAAFAAQRAQQGQQAQQGQKGQQFNFQRPQVFSVLDMPQGPSPLDLALDVAARQQSGKSDFPSFNRMPSTDSRLISYNTGLDELSMFN